METAVLLVAMVLAVVQPVPQVVRVARARTTAGVSSTSTMFGIVVNVAWVAYSVARGLPPVAVLSALYLLGYVVVAVVLWRAHERRGVLPALGLGVAFAAVVAVAGWELLGAVLAFMVAVQHWPQVREAWRADDLSGLAPGTYAVYLADAVVWGGYGILVNDRPLVLYGAVMLAVVVSTAIPWLRWRARRPARQPATAIPA